MKGVIFMNYTKLSIFISKVLRHQPELIDLEMDKHGWVSVTQLIAGVNRTGSFKITKEVLREIVETDSKKRYSFNENETRIKANQGHSIPWVEPELIREEPPMFLYHGTNTEAYGKIRKSGFISKMKRHAVHMQAEQGKAWQSAQRWKGKTPVVLKIDAQSMFNDGFVFGRSENDVWCVEKVPIQYIVEELYMF